MRHLLILVMCLGLRLTLAVRAQEVFINEATSANGGSVTDDDGDSTDWIELFNSGSRKLDLAGWGLTDSPKQPFKWVFRPTAIDAGGFLVVCASGKDRQPEPVAPLAPDAVSGLAVWLGADAVALDDETQVRRADGAVYVRRWQDRSGQDNAASQDADDLQPRWIAEAIGGRPVLRFDGIDDELTLLRITGTNDFCLMVVARPTQGRTSDSPSNLGFGGLSGQRYLFGAGWSGDPNIDAGSGVCLATNGIAVYEHGVDYMPALAVYDGPVGSGFVVATVNYETRRPGLFLQSTTNRPGLTSPRSHVTAPVEIGAGAYGAFAGDIAEILMFNRALASAERTGVEQYLASKYGLQFSYPRHTNFRISSQGEKLLLTRPEGQVADVFPASPMPRNASYGRQPDGSLNFRFFVSPTPGASNSTPGVAECLGAPLFSHAGGFYAGEFHLTMQPNRSDVAIHYTLDGSAPSESSPLYAAPILIRNRAGTANDISSVATTFPPGPLPAGEVFKGWVVRARAFKSGAIPSPLTTCSYWVDPRGPGRYTLPVISLATDRANLFDPDIGIYVSGNAPDGNYSQRGPAWVRPVHVEFFEGDKRLAFSQDAGLSIHGNTSQYLPAKALDLDGINGDGRKPFNHRLFPDRARAQFQHFLLRPSGQDQPMAFMRDELAQSLAAETGAETQASRACILFINGEYWGLTYLKEKEDAEFLSYYSGLPADQLDYLEGYAAPKIGDVSLYWALQAFLAAGDLTQPGTYAQAATFLDIPNYIDFKLLEIHAYRWDIGGNQRMWRPHTPEGRFRWLQYDNDVAYGGFGASEPAWEFNMLAADVTPDGSLNGHNDETRVFTLRQLLTLPEFRRDFINRYADLLNTLLRPAHLIDRVDALAGVLAPEMEEHIRRWIEPASMDEWHNHVQHLRDYASRRPEFARQQVMQQFGLSGVATLSLSVSDTNRGTLRINTLSISAPAPSPWTGVYFKDNPISVTAVPNPGYWLAGWRGTSGADPANGTATNLTLRLTGDLALQALFEPDPTLLPSIGRFSRTPQGDLELSVQGVPRQAYDVQSSTDLAIWLPIQSVVIGPAGAAEVIVTDPGNTKARFYRLWKR